MLDKNLVSNILETYKKSWINQDSDLILTIFNSDATYGEYLLKNYYTGHNEIKKYWEEKVVNEQLNIEFDLLETFIDDEKNVFIAKWDVSFDSNIENKRIHLVEIGIFHIDKETNKIKKYEEYWHSERL